MTVSSIYTDHGMAICHCCLSPCQFANLTASRLTLSRPHNLSVALSIWSRDDDTSNHAPVHRCDDALSPLLFSNVFTSLTCIGTRTVLLHEEGRPLQSDVIYSLALYILPGRVLVSRTMHNSLLALSYPQSSIYPERGFSH